MLMYHSQKDKWKDDGQMDAMTTGVETCSQIRNVNTQSVCV